MGEENPINIRQAVVVALNPDRYSHGTKLGAYNKLDSLCTTTSEQVLPQLAQFFGELAGRLYHEAGLADRKEGTDAGGQ